MNKSRSNIEKGPLVAIGVPVYNGDKYLKECLDSLLDQTYQSWECIIIDNCSTDDTNNIARTYVEKDARFKLKRNTEFLDVMQNWNETYRNISTDAKYFKIVPADDWLLNNFLSETVSLMEANPNVGICSSFRIDGTKVRGNGLNIYDGNIFNGRKVLVDELLLKIDVTGSGNTVIYRNDILKQLSGYPKIFSEVSLHVDTELAYEVMNLSDFGYIFQVLSYTRRHENSITNSLVYRFNTSICFRDNELMKYKHLIDNFHAQYKKQRNNYAVLYAKRLLNREKKWLKWHKSHLINKFTFAELMNALVSSNLPWKKSIDQRDR